MFQAQHILGGRMIQKATSEYGYAACTSSAHATEVSKKKDVWVPAWKSSSVEIAGFYHDMCA